MTYTHCQNCGHSVHNGIPCDRCGWRPDLAYDDPVDMIGIGHLSTHAKNVPGLKWHRDTPTGWTPERAKACYDYCEGVDVELLTPGGLQRMREAYAALQVKYDVLVKRGGGNE